MPHADLILWLILALIAGAAALWLIRPLTLAVPPALAEEAARAGAYRAALVALEGDKAGALIEAEAAAGERALLARALIAETTAPLSPPPAATKPLSRGLILGLALLVPVAGAALYLGTGLSADGSASALGYLSEVRIDAILQEQQRKVAADPQNPNLHRTLGRIQFFMGRFADAAKSYERVLALGPRTSDDLTAHAEVLARASGRVEPQVLADLDEALKLDPANSFAHADRASAREAVGDFSGAREDWLYLANVAPPGQWKDNFAARAEAAARAAKNGPAPLATSDTEAALIQGMVSRLAARLEANPNDLPGWLRLIHAYVVLGDRDKGNAAALRARALFGHDAKAAAAIDAQAAPLK